MVPGFRLFVCEFLEADSECSKVMPKDENEKPEGIEEEEETIPCGCPFLVRFFFFDFLLPIFRVCV